MAKVETFARTRNDGVARLASLGGRNTLAVVRDCLSNLQTNAEAAPRIQKRFTRSPTPCGRGRGRGSFAYLTLCHDMAM